jgi:hypothetical protein
MGGDTPRLAGRLSGSSLPGVARRGPSGELSHGFGRRAANGSTTDPTRIIQQVGGSFGSAILALVLARALTSHHAVTAAALALAFNTAFWWAIAATVVLRRRRCGRRHRVRPASGIHQLSRVVTFGPAWLLGLTMGWGWA